MKYFYVGSLNALLDNHFIEAETSKLAVEKHLGEKVKCDIKANNNPDYVSTEATIDGLLYGDYRKRKFWKIIQNQSLPTMEGSL